MLQQAVPERSPLVQQGHRPVEGLTHGNARPAQGITPSAGLYLILAVVELAGQVLRQGAGVVQAQDQCQFPVAVQNRAVGIVGAERRHGKALVVIRHKGRQEGVGGVDIADPPQPQFLDEAILKRLVGSLNPAFRLRTVGVYGLDIEGFEGTGELGEFSRTIRVIDPENAVLVGIQGNRNEPC